MSNNWFKEFEQALNQDIKITINEHDYEFNLIEVKDISSEEQEVGTSYKLLFLSPFKEKYFNQGVFRVHLEPDLEIPVFMVPIGQESKTSLILYEAIFN